MKTITTEIVTAGSRKSAARIAKEKFGIEPSLILPVQSHKVRGPRGARRYEVTLVRP